MDMLQLNIVYKFELCLPVVVHVDKSLQYNHCIVSNTTRNIIIQW